MVTAVMGENCVAADSSNRILISTVNLVNVIENMHERIDESI